MPRAEVVATPVMEMFAAASRVTAPTAEVIATPVRETDTDVPPQISEPQVLLPQP